MNTTVIEGIKIELARLDRPEWLQIIEMLAQNFQDYPFDSPETQAPLPEIYAILQTIEPGELPESTDAEFIRQLSHADIFSFRAYRSTLDGPIYWEPLRERLADFARGADATMYQSEYEYPSPDVIRGWFYHKLRIVRQ